MELKPCPFCGHKPAIEFLHHTDGEKWGAVCCCCNGPEVRTGYGPVEEWRDAAIKEWNTRPIEDAQSAEISRLRARVAELEKFEASMRCPNCDNLRLEIGQLRRRVAELEAMLHDIIDSIPSTYDKEDPTVKRHAAALNVAWNSLKEVGHDG